MSFHPRLRTQLPLFELTHGNTEFAVNGTNIPDVDFDVGESYAGTLPISQDPEEKSELFWWFFPSTNPAAKKEILIWLNGGVSLVSCQENPQLKSSSLSNKPFVLK